MPSTAVLSATSARSAAPVDLFIQNLLAQPACLMQRTARSCSAKVSTAGFIEGGWPTGLVPCWDAVKYLRHSSVRIAHLDHQPPDVFVYKPVPLCSGSKGRQSTLGFLFRGPKAFE